MGNSGVQAVSFGQNWRPAKLNKLRLVGVGCMKLGRGARSGPAMGQVPLFPVSVESVSCWPVLTLRRAAVNVASCNALVVPLHLEGDHLIQFVNRPFDHTTSR